MIPSMTLALCQGPCSRSVIASWDCWAAVEWAKSSMESRSEEHTSELQSRLHLVCRLLLEKKKYLALQILDVALMKLLVDAHTFLWVYVDPPRFYAPALASLPDPANTSLLSGVILRGLPL